MAIRYTTPTEELTIKGVDLTPCKVTVTLAQGVRKLELPPSEIDFDGERTRIAIELTQEQTGAFFAGEVSVQVNWLDADGNRDATTIASMPWLDNLSNRVMANGRG